MPAPNRNARSCWALFLGAGHHLPMVIRKRWMVPGMNTKNRRGTGEQGVPVFQMPWILSVGTPVIRIVLMVLRGMMPTIITLPIMKVMEDFRSGPTIAKPGL